MTAVGMILFPRLTQLDLTGPYEVFGRLPGTRVHLAAASTAPVVSERGLALLPDTTFAEAPPFDVLFVPGGGGVNALMEDQAFLAFLRRQGEQARYVTAVCTGALLLGAAGLLRGYRATTHWLSLDLLAPLGAEPVAERVVVDRNRITGGGVTAGIDFALALAAILHGEAVAHEVQLMMEYDPRPPFHSGSPGTADPAVVRKVTAARQAVQDERRRIVQRLARATP
jgi:cyclohexyl-isocyanide hydratase